MDKFVIKTKRSLVQQSNESGREVQPEDDVFELSSLVADPGLRNPISEYHPNIRDKVRRAYLQKGPCQPINHNFKKRKIGDLIRRKVHNFKNYLMKGRSRRKVHNVTNLYHYKIEFFYVVLDLQLQELNNRFSESSTELLIYVACLSPNNSFSAFDREKLLRLAQFYPEDFSSIELIVLENQLSTYILDMRSSTEFSMLNGINALAEKLILTKKSDVYHLVYLLVKLALILPVSTASVERGFSAMKIMKNRLRNRMGDQLLNGSLVTDVEKTVFDGVVNEAIVQRFQNMKNRRGQL